MAIEFLILQLLILTHLLDTDSDSEALRAILSE
jgi:hypothetical protein